METYLPFKYGKLYKPKNGIYEYSWMKDYEQIGTVLNHSGNYDQYPPSVVDAGVDESKNFLPISFRESDQIVLGEVIHKISKTKYYFCPEGTNYGMNFKFTNYEERNKTPIRIEIPVETFIKEFEEVL